jgi:hypothetical protein
VDLAWFEQIGNLLGEFLTYLVIVKTEINIVKAIQILKVILAISKASAPASNRHNGIATPKQQPSRRSIVLALDKSDCFGASGREEVLSKQFNLSYVLSFSLIEELLVLCSDLVGYVLAVDEVRIPSL